MTSFADEAARWVVHAVRRRPTRMTPAYATLVDAVGLVSPRLVERLVNAAPP